MKKAEPLRRFRFFHLRQRDAQRLHGRSFGEKNSRPGRRLFFGLFGNLRLVGNAEQFFDQVNEKLNGTNDIVD